MKPTDEQIEYFKRISEFKKDIDVKLCIWELGNDDGTCSDKIIDAHSIQRGKILSSIAKKGKVYYFGLMPSGDLQDMNVILDLEGIKKFSTFKGFCGVHDKNIFQPIEDKSFIASEEQMNIYAYRAVAKELYANLKALEAYKKLLNDFSSSGDNSYIDLCIEKMLTGQFSPERKVLDVILKIQEESSKSKQIVQILENTKINIEELTEISQHMGSVLNREKDSLFEHIYYAFDFVYPIACSSNFIPYYSYDGSRIIADEEMLNLTKSKANLEDNKMTFLNIFPEDGKTHVIFSFLKKNKKLKKSLDALFKLDNCEIKLGLSNLILNYVENFAVNPDYIDQNFTDAQLNILKDTYISNLIPEKIGSFKSINFSLFVDEY